MEKSARYLPHWPFPVPAKSCQHCPDSWFLATLHQPSWLFSMFWEAVSRASTILWKCLWKSHSHTPKVFVVTLYAICCVCLGGKDENKWERWLMFRCFGIGSYVPWSYHASSCTPRPFWHRAPTRWWPEPAPTLPAWRRCRARRGSFRVWEGFRWFSRSALYSKLERLKRLYYTCVCHFLSMVFAAGPHPSDLNDEYAYVLKSFEIAIRKKDEVRKLRKPTLSCLSVIRHLQRQSRWRPDSFG